MKETFIQIGVTALRTPSGDFLPSVPLYIKTSEAVKANGLTSTEEGALHAIGEALALKHIALKGAK